MNYFTKSVLRVNNMSEVAKVTFRTDIISNQQQC